MMDVAALTELANNAGVWGGAAGGTMVAIRWLRKPFVQDLLPRKWRWKNLPRPARYGVLGLSALATTMVAGLTAGMAPGAAAVAAIPAVLGAVFGHKATKAVGHGLQLTSEAARESYTPGKLRRTLDSAGALPLNFKSPKLRIPK